MMTKNEIFLALKSNLLDVLPELNEQHITTEQSLKNLGANSLDRAEIIIRTMAKLGLTLPLITLATAQNIDDIISLFYASLQKTF